MNGLQDWKLPHRFGRYQLERLLGSGAMGSVFLAEDTLLRRHVAIKTPRFGAADREELLARFYREARAVALLRHRNVCPIFDVDEIDGVPFLSMAYIDGKPLSAFITPEKPVPCRAAAQLTRKIALGLAHAHENGILHRDLKPANIMLDSQREPIVMDFGLAANTVRPNEARMTRDGAIVGTPAYMSPEQIRSGSPVTAASDVYGLGVVLFEMITGQLPFDGPVVAIVGQVLTQPPPRPSSLRAHIDPELDSLCLKMLEKRPEDRFPSMQAVAEALTKYLATPPGERGTAATTVITPAKTREPAAESPISRTLLSTRFKAAMAGIGVLTVALLAFVMFGGSKTAKGTIRLLVDSKAAGTSHSLTVDGHLPLSSDRAEAIDAGEHVIVFRTEAGEHRSAPFRIQDGKPHVLTAAPGDRLPILRLDGRTLDWANAPPNSEAFVANNESKSPSVEPTANPLTSDANPAKPDEPDPGTAAMVARQLDRSRELNVPLEMTNSLGAKLVFIPDGEFEMGTLKTDLPIQMIAARSAGEPDWWIRGMPSESPRHRVRITKPFYMASTETTIAQFREFVKATNHKTGAELPEDSPVGGVGWLADEHKPDRQSRFNWRSPGFPQEETHPVVMVTWSDAEAFCKWLSEQEGRVYRLPTEAEWEYAHRAGSTTEWPTGRERDSLEGFANILDQSRVRAFGGADSNHVRAVTKEAVRWDDGFGWTAPAGSLKANPLGVFDMPGNVKEWCRDFWVSGWYDSSPVDDPVASEAQVGWSARIQRGGSFALPPGLCRSSTRWQDPASPVWYDQGFRYVCEVTETSGKRDEVTP